MSGGLFVNALLRETEEGATAEQVARIQALHAQAYNTLAPRVRPLPGARELLTALTAAGVPWAIATSGCWEVARPVLKTLGVAVDATPLTPEAVLRLIHGASRRSLALVAGPFTPGL